MNKFIFNMCRGLPIVGNLVTVAYLANLVTQLHKKVENDPITLESRHDSLNDMDIILKEKADELFEEYFTPEIARYNIPVFLINRVKSPAINKMIPIMRKKISK